MSGIFKAVKSAFTSKGLDKPKYKEGNKYDGFEEREYEACKWVSIKTMGMTHKDGVTKGFWKLFQYISGENDRNQKVEMTAPVATQIVPGAGPNCENTFTVSFYIPPEHQHDPPKPKHPDVFISDWPKMTVLVKSFSGFANDDSWIENGRLLAEAADKTEWKDKYVKDFYFTAGSYTEDESDGSHDKDATKQRTAGAENSLHQSECDNEVWFITIYSLPKE